VLVKVQPDHQFKLINNRKKIKKSLDIF